MTGAKPTSRLLVVGNGMATSYLLEDLLREGQANYDITVVSAEPQPAAYNRILLSSLLAGEKRVEDLWMQGGDWYAQQGVTLVAGTAVTGVDMNRRRADLADGRQLSFDSLVFATGSRPHIPELPGSRLPGVMGFRSLADVEQLLRAGTTKRRAVVVGGGLLGLEAAHGLRHLGMEVAVVHRRGYLMNRQLDRRAAALLQKNLESRGIEIHLQANLVAIEGDTCVESVRLNNGSLFSCDLLLFAAGIDPNKELAERAGIRCRSGILVDGQMRTSHPDVFALGECCECDGRTFGLVAPVRQQARVLANILGGGTDHYDYVETPVHLKVSGVEMHSNGCLDESDCEALVLEDATAGIYRRLLLRDDRLVGSVLLGDKTGGSWYDELIASQIPIGALRRQLMFGQRPLSANN